MARIACCYDKDLLQFKENYLFVVTLRAGLSTNYHPWIILKSQMEITVARVQSQMLSLCHGINWQQGLKHTCENIALIVPCEQTNRHPLSTGSMTIWGRSNTKHNGWSERTVLHLVVVKSLFCCVLQTWCHRPDCSSKKSSYGHKTNMWCLEDSPQRSAPGLTGPGDNGSGRGGLDHWCRPWNKHWRDIKLSVGHVGSFIELEF